MLQHSTTCCNAQAGPSFLLCAVCHCRRAVQGCTTRSYGRIVFRCTAAPTALQQLHCEWCQQRTAESVRPPTQSSQVKPTLNRHLAVRNSKRRRRAFRERELRRLTERLTCRSHRRSTVSESPASRRPCAGSAPAAADGTAVSAAPLSSTSLRSSGE